MVNPHGQTGNYYEKKASEFLRAQGYRILERNYRCRWGEIDLICIHRHCLVFVEVRYRRLGGLVSAAESVKSPKQQRIRRAAAHWLSQGMKKLSIGEGIHFLECRYDLMTCDGQKWDHWIDAW